MEPAAPEVIPGRSDSFLFFVFLLFIFLAVVSGVGGYYLGARQGLEVLPQPQTQQTFTEAELPIDISLLKNPIISKWQGTVKGNLVAKEENSITIEDEVGNRITIPLRVSESGVKPKFLAGGARLDSSAISFSEIISGGITATPSATYVDLEEVPLNVDIQAEFYVRSTDKNQILGFDFIYFEGAGE